MVSLTKRIGGRTYRLTNPHAKYAYPPYISINEAKKQVDRYRKAGNLVHLVKSTIKGKEYGLLYVYPVYDLKREKK